MDGKFICFCLLVIFLLLTIVLKEKKLKTITGTLACLSCCVVLTLYLIPVIKDIKLGLDLQGGFEVLYQVEPLEDDTTLTEDMMVSTYKTLTNRINVLGVSEPVITIEGDNLIRVQLAGITDAKSAKDVLSTTASLS
ncbi:MAG: hypothetical protein Q4G04_02340, partial [bacterium]|nr:hypothetical protein [bacterium]